LDLFRISSFKWRASDLLNEHIGTINKAIFSSDGKRILTASADGTAKLWYTPEAIIDWLKK
jgi:WD40 repeat protein